jgi:hypothetical protein
VDGILKEVKTTPSICIILYFFGVLFFVMSLYSVILHGYIESLLFILTPIVAILASSQLKKGINTSIPGFVIFFVVFFIVVVAIVAFPVSPTAVNNSSLV